MLRRRRISPTSIWLMFRFHQKQNKSCKCNNSREYFFNIKITLQEDQDWGFVAMVLDRLFLWLFTSASLFGTFAILCEAPALWVFANVCPQGLQGLFSDFISFPRKQIRRHSAYRHRILDHCTEAVQPYHQGPASRRYQRCIRCAASYEWTVTLTTSVDIWLLVSVLDSWIRSVR